MGASKRVLRKRDNRRKFLEAYSKTGNVTLSAKRAGILPRRHYEWLNDDSEYEQLFAFAHQVANENLEAEAYRRAVEGILKPQWFQGKKCGTVREYSDTLLIFMMKGRMPDKYRDNSKIEMQHSGTIARRVELSTLTDEQLAFLQTLTGVSISGAGQAPGHLLGPGSGPGGSGLESAP